MLPHESASHRGDESPEEAPERLPMTPDDAPFPFKFKAPSGRVHRLQVSPAAGMTELIASVTSKLGSEIDVVGGAASFDDNGKTSTTSYALSYLDNEGDTVSITTNQDLLDAILMAKRGQRDKVDLFVHDPDKPPMTATVDPRPALAKPMTPPESEIRSRRAQAADDGDDEEETPVKREPRHNRITTQERQSDQVIAGVPNDLLLPGAVVVLAVVIAGVFAFSRASSR